MCKANSENSREMSLGNYVVVTAAAYFSVVRLACCTQNAGEISGEVTTEKTGREIEKSESRFK